jgi:hypothetical protein
MRIAFADPPYLGCCGLYDHRHEAPYGCWDDIGTHRHLIRCLCSGYPDGWALSLNSPSLEEILHVCREVIGPNQARVGTWVKPFASFKPNVNPAYAWEPVIFYGGRKRGRDLPTVRDWVAENITMEKGLTGAKPLKFCYWLFEFLGMQAEDEFCDVFPGTGIVGQAWEIYKSNSVAQLVNLPMFVEPQP